jgi:hypothetical protein
MAIGIGGLFIPKKIRISIGSHWFIEFGSLYKVSGSIPKVSGSNHWSARNLKKNVFEKDFQDSRHIEKDRLIYSTRGNVISMLKKNILNNLSY